MKTNLVVGIDVSKLDLDFAECSFLEGKRKLESEERIENTVKCLKTHLSFYDKASVRMVFEPTGTYSDKLQQVLTEMGFVYHTVNPRQSHHYALSKGVINKTDRQAARMLAEMGQVLDLPVHQPSSKINQKRKQLLKAILGLEKEERVYKNKLHALTQLVDPVELVVKAYKDLLVLLASKIADLEKELVDLPDAPFEAKKKLGMTVCGIGSVTATWLLTLTNGLDNFDKDKKVIKFLGLAPGSHRSGTSVNKKSGINKGCTGKARGTLFMAAKSAIRYNPACKDLYERLRAKGKNYYQAIVAVMCKLVRQFFAVVKSGVKYDKEYHLKFKK